MKTVELTSCINSVEARLLQGNLANEDIESFISNENFNSLYPNVFGTQIRIFVLEKDLTKATKIVNSVRK